MPKPKPITITIDLYTAELLRKKLGNDTDATIAIQQAIQHLLNNHDENPTQQSIRGVGTPQFERDLVQMMSHWVASGSVKTMEQASGKLLTYGTCYPIFHLWGKVKKRAASLSTKPQNP